MQHTLLSGPMGSHGECPGAHGRAPRGRAALCSCFGDACDCEMDTSARVDAREFKRCLEFETRSGPTVSEWQSE